MSTMAVFIKVSLFIDVLYIMFTTMHSAEQTFFKEELTWFEAQRCCASRLGQLASIDDADGEIVNCHNIPPDSNDLKIWTGNIRRHSEWIEFQGCFEISGKFVRANNISECYQSCIHKQRNSFEYFAFKENQCMCHLVIRQTHANKYLCHTPVLTYYSWVYKVLYNASFDGYGNCVTSKCSTGSNKKVVERCSALQIPMCGLTSSTTNWTKSQSNCKTPTSMVNHATGVCELNKDTTTETGMWTNIFRVEISAHVDNADKIDMTEISSCVITKCPNNIAVIKYYYTNCDETADALFCKTAHRNTIKSSRDCNSQTTSIYNLSRPHTIAETTISSFASRYKHQLSSIIQDHYSTEALVTVNTARRLSIAVTTTIKPRDLSTTITKIRHRHVTYESNNNTIGLICGVTDGGLVLIAVLITIFVGLICGVTVGGLALIGVIILITCKMRNVGPFRKQLLYEDTIDMNSVGYAIPDNYDTVLNTDNGSVPNVYINSDTGENTYDTID